MNLLAGVDNSTRVMFGKQENAFKREDDVPSVYSGSHVTDETEVIGGYQQEIRYHFKSKLALSTKEGWNMNICLIFLSPDNYLFRFFLYDSHS